MAMVQVDLSEYDMLREAKKKTEKEVEEFVRESYENEINRLSGTKKKGLFNKIFG